MNPYRQPWTPETVKEHKTVWIKRLFIASQVVAIAIFLFLAAIGIRACHRSSVQEQAERDRQPFDKCRITGELVGREARYEPLLGKCFLKHKDKWLPQEMVPWGACSQCKSEEQ